MSVEKIVGKVVRKPLAHVKPNPWNDNEMTSFQESSLRTGLQEDGWLASQALLVWGTDDKGRARNVIIDGEHRWKVATALGFKEGPMVFLKSISELEARKLTIKINRKRGQFVKESLEAAVRVLQHTMSAEQLALSLGIPEENLMLMFSEREEVIPDVNDDKPPAPAGSVELPSGKTDHVKMVQLFFNETMHEEFLKHINRLSKKFETTNATDTILETFRHASKQRAPKDSAQK